MNAAEKPSEGTPLINPTVPELALFLPCVPIKRSVSVHVNSTENESTQSAF